MSLKVGLLSISELYEESLRKRVTGISLAAKLLMQLFDALEPLLIAGITPQQLKTQAHFIAAKLNIHLSDNQIAFCRLGYVHPSLSQHLDVPLAEGEAFTLDIWINHQGYHADLARIYMLEPFTREYLHLQRAALAIQESAVQAAKVGNRLLSIVQAAQQTALQHNVHIIEGACGHGVGHHLHEEPVVAFCYNAGSPFSKLKAGTIITIEPLVSTKPANLIIEEDEVVRLPPEIPYLYAEAMIYIGQEQTIVIGR